MTNHLVWKAGSPNHLIWVPAGSPNHLSWGCPATAVTGTCRDLNRPPNYYTVQAPTLATITVAGTTGDAGCTQANGTYEIPMFYSDPDIPPECFFGYIYPNVSLLSWYGMSLVVGAPSGLDSDVVWWLVCQHSGPIIVTSRQWRSAPITKVGGVYQTIGTFSLTKIQDDTPCGNSPDPITLVAT